LSDAKAELEDKKAELEKQEADTTAELAAYSKMLDEAMATKAAYTTQVTSLKASQTALKAEKDAYKKNKVSSNYKDINKMIKNVRDTLSSDETYQKVYEQIYSQVLIQSVQAAVTQAGMNMTVTAENVETVLATLGPAADTIRTTAASVAETTAKEQIQKQIDSLPTDIKDAIDHPKKLKALKSMLEEQGQKKAAEQLTKENLQTLYDIVNTRIPQIDTELANLEVEIKAAEAVLEQVEASIAEAEANYTKVEEGKMTAASSFGNFKAQMQSGETAITEGEKELETAQETLDDSREKALESANLDEILTKDMLSQILTAENFSMPAGYIKEGEEQYLVKVGETYASVEELENSVLCHIDEIGDVTLSDVADISIVDNAKDSYARMNDNKAIILSIKKASTAGTSTVSKTCNEAMEELMSQYEGLHLTTLVDQGDYIGLIIDSVLSNLIWGAVLAIIVLAIFLKDPKPTIVVAFSIPLSVLFAIVLMYFSDITLNIISLSGLALGVGMLVDNSIVVIENIYRYRNEGMSAPRAAVKGANEVAGAVFASTLTTICVFLPLVFASGLVRQLFVDMGLTIAYSLLASLVVALTLVPCMGATVLKNTKEKEHRWFDAVINAYEKLLRLCLKFKAVPLLIAVGLLVFCIWQVTRIGMIMLPDMGGNQMSVTFTAPEEMSLEEGYQMADDAVDFLKEIEGVTTVGAMAGGDSALMGMGEADNKAFSFFIILDEEASKDNSVIAKKIEKYLVDLGHEDLEYTVSTSNMDMSALLGSGMEIVVYGQETDTLLKISEDIMEILSEVKGFEEITNGQEEGDSEIRVIVDKNAAMKHGLTVAQIYQELSNALTTEKTATTLNVKEDDYEVVIVDETKNVKRDTLLDYVFEVNTKDEDGKEITEEHTLGEFAKLENAESLATISRENQARYITVTAQAMEGYNTTLLSREVEKKIANYEVPENYTVEIAGESSSVNEAMEDLLLMILLAIVFIYLIMVAQFQSLLSPFVVLFTIPLAFTGGFLALFLTGEELSVVAMMGFLVLAGVVVNNGIVFVDSVNQMRLAGMEKKEALIDTGKKRMRPILMTAMTTILAMFTMVASTDAASVMGRGMALVTIGGLAYATLMTLFIVPVLYDIVFRGEMKQIDLEDAE